MHWTYKTLLLFAYGLAWAVRCDAGLNVLDTEVLDRASVRGKYVNLLHVIEVPEDKADYGVFCDWGYWEGYEYSGYSNLEPGFWVYVHPRWYVWEKISSENDIDPRASVYGKYAVLLHVLEVPKDVNQYGSFYDWGFYEGYSYAGYTDLTPGYWVYLDPNWYVWAAAKEISGGGT